MITKGVPQNRGNIRISDNFLPKEKKRIRVVNQISSKKTIVLSREERWLEVAQAIAQRLKWRKDEL